MDQSGPMSSDPAIRRDKLTLLTVRAAEYLVRENDPRRFRNTSIQVFDGSER